MGDALAATQRELLKTKVDTFMKEVARRNGLLPGPHVYHEFVLADEQTLFLKDGLKRVTWKNMVQVLQSLRSANFIQTHQFCFRIIQSGVTTNSRTGTDAGW